MVTASKREYYWYRCRFRLVPSLFAFLGFVFGTIGYNDAVFVKINGLIGCSEMFDAVWKCVVFPVAVIIISYFVKDRRKKAVSIMVSKIVTTVIGLAFGINTNIRIPLFCDDWGVLFFIAVDVIILYIICTASDGRPVIMGGTTVILFVMLISHIIIRLDGDPSPTYIYRMISQLIYYYPVWYIVKSISKRWLKSLTREKWEILKKKEGDTMSDIFKDGWFAVKGDDGDVVECDVLFTFDCTEDNRTYVVYTSNTRDSEGNIEVYAAYIDEDGESGPRLMNVEDEEMFETIEHLLNALSEIARKNADEGHIS